MAMEFVNAETLNLALLAKIYEQAYLDVTFDEEAELLNLHDDVVAEANVEGNPDRIQLLAVYGIQEDAEETQLLHLINRVMVHSKFLRACRDDDGDLAISHTILLKGGVTKRAILEATRLFLAEVPKVIEACDTDDIVE